VADENHIAILKQGVEVWNEWRLKNQNVAPDLSGASLRMFDLSEADLSESDLSDADLTGANLSRAELWSSDLSGAVLSGAKLIEADLGSATLIESDMTEANLKRVDLSDSDLHLANFLKANLSEANLSSAYAVGADLSYSDLTAANFASSLMESVNFSNAHCGYTAFTNIDLSTAKGLETIRHDGPSYLDVHTLYHSQGKIPDVFLRGCGVHENLITYLPSLLGLGINFYSCFISYSHEDKPFARRLHDALQGRGIRCWLDEKQMNPGDDIYEEVDRGIRYWDKVLLCCSKSALSEKWWVDHEIDKAFQKERDLMKERGEKVLSLIPLDLDGYLFSNEYDRGKAQQIRSRIAADFNGWEHDNSIFEREFERIVKALRTDGGKEIPPQSRL
jgi:hypothetical protein